MTTNHILVHNILGLYRDNGKENGNYYVIWGFIRGSLGLGDIVPLMKIEYGFGYIILRSRYGDFGKLGVPFGVPHNKDYSILGSI